MEIRNLYLSKEACWCLLAIVLLTHLFAFMCGTMIYGFGWFLDRSISI